MIFMLKMARWGIVVGIFITVFLMFVGTVSNGFVGFLSFVPAIVGLYLFSRFLHRAADNMKKQKNLYKKYGKNGTNVTSSEVNYRLG